jgi:hypothetical protein
VQQLLVVLCSKRFETSTNGSSPAGCKWLRNIVESTIFKTRQNRPLFARLNVASASEIPELSGFLPWTETHWAYAFGGGADYDLSDRFAIRVQADWIRSHFPETFARDFQNNYRVAGGIVFKFR